MAGKDLATPSEKNWLVKSSTRILGPYTIDEIALQLQDKNISIIDEIRQPWGRWNYIRENDVLLEVIRRIRDEEDPHSDKTMTQSLAQHTVTKTDSDSFNDDKTPAPFIADISPQTVASAGGLKDISASEISLPRTIPSSGAIKSYGSADDNRLLSSIAERSKFMQFGLIILTVLIAIYVVMNLSNKKVSSMADYDDLRSSAIRFKSLGLYDKSLGAYKKAIQIKEPDFDFSAQMAPVLITEDRQTVEGRRVLEKALAKEGQDRSQIMDAYLGIAVSHIMEGDIQEAEEILQKALGHEPGNFAALMNLAIIKLRKGLWNEASQAFEALYSRNNRNSLVLIGKALADIEHSRKSGQTGRLDELEKELNAHIKKNNYLRQELTLLRAYALKLLGEVDKVNQAVVQFLGFLPGEAKLYSHPLYVDWRYSRWEVLEKYCQWLYPGQSPHAGFKALRAVCLMENNRDTDASRFLKESKAEAPKDPFVLQTEAAFLFKMSRYPEAVALLKMPELMSLEGKSTLSMDYCIQQNDTKCVLTSSNQGLKINPRSAAAYYGLAWASWQKKDRAKAFDYIRSGLEIEPQYIPLIELRDSLEAK